MTIYGLRGYTHGWGKLVTVMSPEGDSAARAAITAPADDLMVVAGKRQLTQYHAKRHGALDRLIAAHHIIVLDKPAWDAKKAELGEAVYHTRRDAMELYGHLGWSHGGARVITLMSPNGAAAVIERFADENGIFLLFAGSRQLPHFHVQQDGTLERLIEDHGIVILDFIAWTDKKSELGEMILSRP